MKRVKRTDAHRPGAMIPAQYRHVLSYNLSTTQDGWPVPSFGVNCELDRQRFVYDSDGKVKEVIKGEHDPDGRCCIVGMTHIAKVKWAEHGNTGKCGSCGTHFVYGSVFVHEPTGEHVHIGNICADKMEMLADRSEYEMARDRKWAAVKTQLIKAEKAEQRAAFLADHPGLKEALECEHDIVQDIKRRFIQWATLSEKQIALVHKINKEENEPKPPETPKIPAPIQDGRMRVRGEVVSVKIHEGFYGDSWKMTVKIQGDGGEWLAWGTCPMNILNNTGAIGDKDEPFTKGVEKGDTVEFEAKFKQGREEYFALFSRPTKARIVAQAVELEEVA